MPIVPAATNSVARTKQEARAAGLPRYFTGKPCVNGHVADRYVSQGGRCVVCHRDGFAKWLEKNQAHNTARAKKWRQKNYATNYEYHRRRLRKQRGQLEAPSRSMPEACECCGNLRGWDKWDALQEDHNHATGAFRGWLCRRCNTGIGLLKDNIDLLLKAVAYLRKNSL